MQRSSGKMCENFWLLPFECFWKDANSKNINNNNNKTDFPIFVPFSSRVSSFFLIEVQFRSLLMFLYYLLYFAFQEFYNLFPLYPPHLLSSSWLIYFHHRQLNPSVSQFSNVRDIAKSLEA